MTRIKRLFASVLLTFSFAAPAMVPAVAMASDNFRTNELCAGADLNFTLDAPECEQDAADSAGQGLTNIVETIINIISLIVAVVAVIMIIIGGFQYLTSQGDSGKVTNARNTILYAIVGLVVVALAQIIVQFVTRQLDDAAPSS